MERSSSAAVGTAIPSDPAPHAGSDLAGTDPAQAPAGAQAHAADADADAAPPGVAHAWAALGGDGALLERISCTRRAALPARLPVLDLARASVAVCSLAAAELWSARASGAGAGSLTGGAEPNRGNGAVPSVQVDDGAVATSFTSSRHLRRDGRAPVTFSPLSRFWRTADGWVRTHANYPHHRTRLLSALGISVEDRDDTTLAEILATELAQRDAAEVEETVHASGGLAVAVRTQREWAAHAQGAQVSRRPLLTTARMDQSPARALPEPSDGPMHAVRVLDLTRVLAGPVATRALALFGADVLRIDAPQLPENLDTHADTGAGKRSALLDLSSRSGQATFDELLSAADVVVTGYRPGALDRFGLAPESLADRRPGLVVAQLSAWGAYGPWHRRRGFDSLVQAASGISIVEGQQDDADGEGIPGALPAQALDHGTGYLLAAAVMRALTDQRQQRGGARLVRLALAQTANWLTGALTSQASEISQVAQSSHRTRPEAADTAAQEQVDPAPWLAETDSPLGRMRYALPPLSYGGCPADWPHPPGMPGTDPAAWW